MNPASECPACACYLPSRAHLESEAAYFRGQAARGAGDMLAAIEAQLARHCGTSRPTLCSRCNADVFPRVQTATGATCMQCWNATER